MDGLTKNGEKSCENGSFAKFNIVTCNCLSKNICWSAKNKIWDIIFIRQEIKLGKKLVVIPNENLWFPSAFLQGDFPTLNLTPMKILKKK